MSGHPCRAHHILEWARKLGRCPRASVQASLTLGEQQNNNRSKVPSTRRRLPKLRKATLFDRGWQQPLDHPGAQPARRVKDAAGTAQPLVLDSVRWLCYFSAFIRISTAAVTVHLHPTAFYQYLTLNLHFSLGAL